MFQHGDAFIPTATLRPETIHGVTNLWANPNVTYVRALIDGKLWIISKEAAEKLVLQDHIVEVKEEIEGIDLIDKTVTHPLCGTIPILPADFVDPDMATGLVMSVPAHAPFDYIALRDLQQQGKYTQIKPIPLIKVEGYGNVPPRMLLNGQVSDTKWTAVWTPSHRRSIQPSFRKENFSISMEVSRSG